MTTHNVFGDDLKFHHDDKQAAETLQKELMQLMSSDDDDSNVALSSGECTPQLKPLEPMSSAEEFATPPSVIPPATTTNFYEQPHIMYFIQQPPQQQTILTTAPQVLAATPPQQQQHQVVPVSMKRVRLLESIISGAQFVTQQPDGLHRSSVVIRCPPVYLSKEHVMEVVAEAIGSLTQAANGNASQVAAIALAEPDAQQETFSVEIRDMPEAMRGQLRTHQQTNNAALPGSSSSKVSTLHLNAAPFVPQQQLVPPPFQQFQQQQQQQQQQQFFPQQQPFPNQTFYQQQQRYQRPQSHANYSIPQPQRHAVPRESARVNPPAEVGGSITNRRMVSVPSHILDQLLRNNFVPSPGLQHTYGAARRQRNSNTNACAEPGH